MPARIRLQRKGTRNNPYFMLVASSSKTNFRGVALERLAYWFPERHREHERSMILNRPRLKYWFGVGAEPSKSALDFLGKTGFLPKRPPPLGSQSLYERSPSKPLPLGEHPRFSELGKLAIKIVDKIEERERKIDEAKAKQEENARIVLNENEDKDTQIDFTNSMNKFSNYLAAFEKVYPKGSNEQKIALLSFFTTQADQEEEENEEIGASELVERLGITEDEADKIIETYHSVGIPFTNADVMDFKSIKRSVKTTPFERNTDRFFPLKKTVTPMPDFGNDENDRVPYGLFQINSELRAIRAYGARILPRDTKKPAKSTRSTEPTLTRSFCTFGNPFYQALI